MVDTYIRKAMVSLERALGYRFENDSRVARLSLIPFMEGNKIQPNKGTMRHTACTMDNCMIKYLMLCKNGRGAGQSDAHECVVITRERITILQMILIHRERDHPSETRTQITIRCLPRAVKSASPSPQVYGIPMCFTRHLQGFLNFGMILGRHSVDVLVVLLVHTKKEVCAMSVRRMD